MIRNHAKQALRAGRPQFGARSWWRPSTVPSTSGWMLNDQRLLVNTACVIRDAVKTEQA